MKGDAMRGTYERFARIRPEDSIAAVAKHPAFRGFGHLIWPWDDARRNRDVPLSRAGELMPYHSCLDADSMAAALNSLIDDAEAGKTVFHFIYSEEEMRNDPTKRNAGIFFYRGRPGAPFAMVCPGGGFVYVGALHEGFPIAWKIRQSGLNAFVLRYRAGDARRAVEDLAAALRFVFEHANSLSVSPANHSLWGGSAGARLASWFGSAPSFPRAAAAVMAYTGQREFSEKAPPTYSIVGSEDWIASPRVVRRRAEAMRRAGIDTEFREIPDVGHGFGLGVGTSAEGWIDDAIRFWMRHAVSTPPPAESLKK